MKRLTLSLQFGKLDNIAVHRAALPRHRLVKWLTAALPGPAGITVRVVNEAEGRALNLAYRQKDYATNVLTFAYAQQPVVSADLVLCAPVVVLQAQQQDISLVQHYAHLLVHGALHAQGWEHDTDQDAQAMEQREGEILAGLGFPDPYFSPD